MGWQSPEDAMPWVGLYASGASLLCTLAMAADAFQAVRRWRLWFPCRVFTINAVSLTLVAIAMKLPVDLTTDMPGHEDVRAKYISIYFLVTMLANFLPSLGLMGDKELTTNTIALGVLLITIIVNVLIQSSTGSVYDLLTIIVLLIFPVLLPFSVALVVPTSRRILEHRYKELHELDSAHEEVNFSYKELIRNVNKSWMMAETGNPQFVIACSSVSNVLGVICSLDAVNSFLNLVQLFAEGYSDMKSDYKWSMIVIIAVQIFGVLFGCIAPIFRCFTIINHFDISKRWSVNHLNVFKVEKYWTQRLQQWKSMDISLHIPNHHLKITFHSFKNMILNFCIALQITIVVTCKTITLVRTFFLILLSCCFNLCSSLLKRLKEEQNTFDNNVRSEIEEYACYVLFFDEDAQLSKRLLRNTLNSITKVIHNSEKKGPSNLVKLLKRSTGFNRVLEFDTNQVPPLHAKQNQNSWSFVAVTLTTIAIALPNISKSHVKELIKSTREGLQFVRHIEESLNPNTDLVKARKASRRVWNEVELYKWLHIDLENYTLKEKTSKETLRWLVDEAIQIVIKFMSCKNGNLDHLLHKFLAASSMYKISQTILCHFGDQQNWPNDQEIFDWISTLIADILCACFTNLPRVIRMKCHHNDIEKREDGIRDAAQLLGKSKKILKILKPRQLPNIDPESMAYIDNWCVLPKCHIPDGGASSVEIHGGSLSCNESLLVTIV